MRGEDTRSFRRCAGRGMSTRRAASRRTLVICNPLSVLLQLAGMMGPTFHCPRLGTRRCRCTHPEYIDSTHFEQPQRAYSKAAAIPSRNVYHPVVSKIHNGRKERSSRDPSNLGDSSHVCKVESRLDGSHRGTRESHLSPSHRWMTALRDLHSPHQHPPPHLIPADDGLTFSSKPSFSRNMAK